MQLLRDASTRAFREPLILIVEDELSLVFAMREFFTHLGYRVDCAGGPEDAMRCLDRFSYDAVITDLHLTLQRRGEGMAVAACARQRNPHACITMLTAYSSDATEEEARRCGADAYFSKPIDLRELATSIERMLRGDYGAVPRLQGVKTWPRD